MNQLQPDNNIEKIERQEQLMNVVKRFSWGRAVLGFAVGSFWGFPLEAIYLGKLSHFFFDFFTYHWHPLLLVFPLILGLSCGAYCGLRIELIKHCIVRTTWGRAIVGSLCGFILAIPIQAFYLGNFRFLNLRYFIHTVWRTERLIFPVICGLLCGWCVSRLGKIHLRGFLKHIVVGTLWGTALGAIIGRTLLPILCYYVLTYRQRHRLNLSQFEFLMAGIICGIILGLVTGTIYSIIQYQRHKLKTKSAGEFLTD